jgi:hypothetical protein
MCRQGVEVLKFCILCVSAIECVEKLNLVETLSQSQKNQAKIASTYRNPVTGTTQDRQKKFSPE